MLKSVVRTFSLSGDMLHFKRVWDSSESSVSTDNFEYLSRRPGMYGGAVSIGLIFRDGGMIEFIGGTKQEKELLKHIETIVPYK